MIGQRPTRALNRRHNPSEPGKPAPSARRPGVPAAASRPGAHICRRQARRQPGGGGEMTLELPSWASPLISECQNSGEDVEVALKLSADYGRLLPQPGRGETALRWAVLAAVGEHNLTVARVLEAHSDALAILNEAGAATPEGTWGVFAAEAAPHRLEAHRRGGRGTLDG